MLCCFGLFSLKIVLVVQSSNWGDVASCSPIAAPLLLMEYRDRKKIWTAPKNGARGGKSDRILKERENVCFLSSFYEAKSDLWSKSTYVTLKRKGKETGQRTLSFADLRAPMTNGAFEKGAGDTAQKPSTLLFLFEEDQHDPASFSLAGSSGHYRVVRRRGAFILPS